MTTSDLYAEFMDKAAQWSAIMSDSGPGEGDAAEALQARLFEIYAEVKAKGHPENTIDGGRLIVMREWLGGEPRL